MGFTPGLNDALGFDAAGRLLLFRVEPKPGTLPPTREVPYEKYPRIGRIRELQPSGQERAIAEIARFNRHDFGAFAPLNLSYIFVDGHTGDAAETRR